MLPVQPTILVISLTLILFFIPVFSPPQKQNYQRDKLYHSYLQGLNTLWVSGSQIQMFSLLLFLIWPGGPPVITVILLLLLKINIMKLISTYHVYSSPSVWESFVQLTSLQGLYSGLMREQWITSCLVYNMLIMKNSDQDDLVFSMMWMGSGVCYGVLVHSARGMQSCFKNINK